MCSAVESSRAQRFLAVMRAGETPVPIPNTTVKARAAEGTAHSVGEQAAARIKERSYQRSGGMSRCTCVQMAGNSQEGVP